MKEVRSEKCEVRGANDAVHFRKEIEEEDENKDEEEATGLGVQFSLAMRIGRR
jgi:hypothetical protein